MSEKSIVSEYYIHLHVIISCTNTYAHIITSKHMGVCVCVRYGRSPEVIRPPAKCYTASLDDGNCGPQKGRPVRWQP